MTADSPGRSDQDRRRRLAPHWLLPGSVAAVSAVIAIAGADVGDALRYDPAAVRAGQVWRLVSGNFVHLSWPHLIMNAAGLFVAGWLFPSLRTPRRWWTSLVVTAVAVGLGLFLAKPELSWYVGLSGVVHGLLAAGALTAWRAGQASGAIACALIAAKLLWENAVGPSAPLATLVGGAIVPEAHLFGAAAGAALAATRWALRAPDRAPGP